MRKNFFAELQLEKDGKYNKKTDEFEPFKSKYKNFEPLKFLEHFKPTKNDNGSDLETDAEQETGVKLDEKYELLPKKQETMQEESNQSTEFVSQYELPFVYCEHMQFFGSQIRLVKKIPDKDLMIYREKFIALTSSFADRTWDGKQQ